MTTYTVTTLNWNNPAFWSGINEGSAGHTLDLSALPTTFSIDINSITGDLILSDGTTTFKVGDASAYQPPYDATLGGSTNFNFFTTVYGTEGDDSFTTTGADDTIYGGGGNDTIDSLTGDGKPAPALCGYGWVTI